MEAKHSIKRDQGGKVVLLGHRNTLFKRVVELEFGDAPERFIIYAKKK